ncbi:MAG TPA: SIS domain-containing protein [Candidatus Limnocylindria bacterium]|nr:SIS domain-containing protein [Candidatus Limnocylindria bacterium]
MSDTTVELSRQLGELQATVGRLQGLLPAIERAGEALRQSLFSGGKVLTAGNGGSAADALHLAEELVGRFDKERPSLPAVSLCADPTLMTCIANDYGFDRVFERQIEGLGRAGDVLVIFSTSGNSTNLVLALRAARAKGMITMALLGKTGGAARGLADHEIIVPSSTTARVQEIHTFILHAWLSLVEAGY